MAFTTFYRFKKNNEAMVYIDRGINSFDVTMPDYGKFAIGRGMIVFEKKKYGSGEIKQNDIITLKWDMLRENTSTFPIINSCKHGDFITLESTGNLNISFSGEIIDISSAYIKNKLFKGNVKAREVTIKICVRTAVIN